MFPPVIKFWFTPVHVCAMFIIVHGRAKTKFELLCNTYYLHGVHALVWKENNVW